MDHMLKLEIETIEIWHILAVVVSVAAFMILFIKAKRTASLKAFFYVQATMLVWMIAKILKTVSPTEEIRWGFIVLQYLAICLLESAFLEFGYAYYNGRLFTWEKRIILHVCPIIQFLSVFTNPYHYKFYSRYNFWGDSFGVLFYISFVIEYIYIAAGVVLCAKKFKKQFESKSGVCRNILYAGILAPIALNIVYVSKVLHRFFEFAQIPVVFDITPIVFTWSLLLFVYATFKNEFFDISPIMKHEIAYSMDLPMCIVNAKSERVFENETMRKNFKNTNSEAEGKMVKKTIESMKAKEDGHDSVIEYEGKYYKVYSKKIENLWETQHVITFNDITSYMIVKDQLTQKNEELEKANEKLEERIEMLKQTSIVSARNYVARELHDAMGHSLVVTVKLLEVAKLSFEKDKMMALDALEKAIYSIKSGYEEMELLNAGNSKRKVYTAAGLERDLGNILRRVNDSGIQTSFYFRGKMKDIDISLYESIKKICTELATNTLKHSKASNVLLSVSFLEKTIKIHMMDDGMGSEEISKGNGLKGIEERIRHLGGKAEYCSSSEDGFSANITIPIQ